VVRSSHETTRKSSPINGTLKTLTIIAALHIASRLSKNELHRALAAVPKKELIIVAGPNGAGKSTFIKKYLSIDSRPYLCADLIALEFTNLSGLPLQVAAGREFLREPRTS
jgi:hypothetical protein